MRGVSRILFAFAWMALVPSALYAQASITGVVKDPSGALLPGVTVEAASPALIEKVRSVVSDGTGQYRIQDLRPGTYTVTFTLPGFSTVKRDGIELSGAFTATVNADMRVGAVEETVTVTGETPIVDIQNTVREKSLTHEVIDAIPTGRLAKNIAVRPPGGTTQGGVTPTDAIKKIADLKSAFGGTIKKDTLWFFTSYRLQVADNYPGGMFFDTTYNDPTVFKLNLDPNHRVSNDGEWNEGNARLTWQAT